MIEKLLKNIKMEEVDEGIFSCLPQNERGSDYDEKVNAYDLIVGNAVYNRVVWGNWPKNYKRFCREAIASKPEGIFLDAGCGSLVFTAHVYAEANNECVILFDRSIGMLKKGRARLRKLCGRVPKNIVFLHGDVFDLPFKEAVFDTVASFGLLHIFEEKVSLLAELERSRKASGKMFFSMLVGNSIPGRKYLELLRKAGEVAECHSSESLAELLLRSPFDYKLETIGNMAFGRSA